MLSKGFTPQEIDESKSYMIGSLPRQLETNAAIASFLLNVETFSLGLDYDERLPALIGAVTKESADAAARRLLNPVNATIAVAGPWTPPPALAESSTSSGATQPRATEPAPQSPVGPPRDDTPPIPIAPPPAAVPPPPVAVAPITVPPPPVAVAPAAVAPAAVPPPAATPAIASPPSPVDPPSLAGPSPSSGETRPMEPAAGSPNVSGPSTVEAPALLEDDLATIFGPPPPAESSEDTSANAGGLPPADIPSSSGPPLSPDGSTTGFGDARPKSEGGAQAADTPFPDDSAL